MRVVHEDETFLHNGSLGRVPRQALHGPTWAGLIPGPDGGPADGCTEHVHRRRKTPHMSAQRKGEKCTATLLACREAAERNKDPANMFP